MRAKWFAALPAAMLLAGGTATAQTTTTSSPPVPADSPASKPASGENQASSDAGRGAAQKPTTLSSAAPGAVQAPANQTAAGNPTVAQDTSRSAAEQDARYDQLVRAGYAPGRNYYPGQSTYLPLFQRDPRYAALARPIDVMLDHATVRQTAQVLTKVSGLAVGVDKAVPDDIRLTVDARGVPMATVLEAIANQAKLLIAPAGIPGEVDVKALQYQPGSPDKNVQTLTVITPPGIVLRLEPSLKIDDHPAVEFPSPTAPWSEEWFPKPEAGNTASPPSSDGASRSFFGGEASVFNPGDYGGLGGRAFVGSAIGIPGIFGIAAVGDRELVVDEPAGHGEPGVLLTVYRLENGQFLKVSTFLHRFAFGQPRTQRRQSSGGAAPPRPQLSQPGGIIPPSAPVPQGNVSPVSPAP